MTIRATARRSLWCGSSSSGVSATEAEPVPGPLVAVSDTLHEAREAIPPGLVCFPRQEGDDPKIVETWL
jgi:hypothetical protein